MKKFLILYFIFAFLLSILYLALRLEAGAQKADTFNKNQRKKIVVIYTYESEPVARVVMETRKGMIYYEWMKVEEAVLLIKEIKNNLQGHQPNIYLQYDKCPHID